MHINKVTQIGINIVTHIFLLTFNGENRMIKNEIYLALVQNDVILSEGSKIKLDTMKNLLAKT